MELDFQDAEKACLGKIDGLWAETEIVAAYGDDGPFAGNQRLKFLLQAGELRMSGENPGPVGEGDIYVFEGIERIEK